MIDGRECGCVVSSQPYTTLPYPTLKGRGAVVRRLAGTFWFWCVGEWCGCLNFPSASGLFVPASFVSVLEALGKAGEHNTIQNTQNRGCGEGPLEATGVDVVAEPPKGMVDVDQTTYNDVI